MAGPVTAAAVILHKEKSYTSVNDSKKLNSKTRETLRTLIEEEALCFGVSHVSPERIDSLNILNASITAMHEAIQKLHPCPEHILVDGNRFHPYPSITHECVIKGDGKFLSIAAASILAKTYRDAYMEAIHEEYPMYNWKQNKGYPTREHREAIRRYGPSPYHRKSFQLLPAQLEIEF